MPKRIVNIVLEKIEIICNAFIVLSYAVGEFSFLFSYIQVKVSRKYDWKLLYYHPNYAINKHQFPTRRRLHF